MRKKPTTCHMFSRKKNRKKKGCIGKIYNNRWMFYYVLNNLKYTKSFDTKKEALIAQKYYIMFYPLIEHNTKKPKINAIIKCKFCNKKMKRSYLTHHLKKICLKNKNKNPNIFTDKPLIPDLLVQHDNIIYSKIFQEGYLYDKKKKLYYIIEI
jgi:hypothetical protein